VVSRIIALLALALLTSNVLAQGYPDKPIRILVGFAAGGPADITARLIGDRLSETWGKPVIVENLTGAAGNLATDRVAKSAPDGYTLLAAASATIVTNPSLYQKLPFDPVKDLAPITQAVYTPNILAVHPDVPARSVQELVAYAKANPGKLSYASFGVGTSAHLNGELLKRLAGIDLVHVPYRGGGEVMRDHLAGNVMLSFDGPTVATANLQTGRVKIIAIAAEARNPKLPDVPTLREVGYEVGRSAYNGLWGPAGMSPAVVEVIHRHVARALARPDIREILEKSGNEVLGMPPSDMLQEVKSAHDYWSRVIPELGVSLD
jgi:tripartite-type tricarboxylate transporter receptor subunit TctC